jgi:hypothetical protein
MIGLFRQRQILAGSVALAATPGVSRPLSLTLCHRRARLLPRLRGPVEVDGEIDAPGFASKRPVRGRVENDALRPLSARYEIEFENDAGMACRLLASRRADLRDLVWSASTVTGEVFDGDGRLLATVTLRLDYRGEIKRLLVD